MKITDRKKFLKATGHVMWIVVMSLCFLIISNEIFDNSGLSKVIILLVIAGYIIFSFARRFWTEKNTKKLLDAIDIMLTIVGGFLLIAIYRSNMEIQDTFGQSIFIDLANAVKEQPHLAIFILGLFLLVAGAIRVFLIYRRRIYFHMQ